MLLTSCGIPMDRTKSLKGIDRDGVARHRNQMHDIALQKQISVIQREGKLIERELREITKVKNTLRQIRSPLKKRVLLSETDSTFTETKRSTQKCQRAQEKKVSSTPSRKEQGLNSVKSSIIADVCEFEKPKLKPIAERDANTCKKNLNVHSSHEQKVLTGSRGGESLSSKQTRNISIGKHEKQSERKLLDVEWSLSAGDNCSLTPVDPFTNTASNLRVPKVEANFNSDKHTTRSVSATSFSKPIPASLRDRPETSMTAVIRKSRLSEQPMAELPLPTARSPRQERDQEDITLTMEETLRIKGKFRQIGHSIIATALLKGIKQRGHLTSEAIHNMHKPVMVSDQAKPQEAEQESKDDDDNNNSLPVKKGLEKFRNATRKTINVNAFIKNSRQKSAKKTEQGASKKSWDEENDQVSSSDHEEKSVPSRKKTFAGVTNAILVTKTARRKISCASSVEDKKVSKKPLMYLSTQERRRKLNSVAVATNPSLNTESFGSDLPKPSKTVTFRLDHAWE